MGGFICYFPPSFPWIFDVMLQVLVAAVKAWNTNGCKLHEGKAAFPIEY